METHKNLTIFFSEAFSELKCDYETKAYISGIFSKFKTSEFDLSKDSVTITFAEARVKQDFLSFQTLGDWLFFSKSFAPDHLNHASEDYYNTVGRLSYYSCYKLMNRKWKIFEQLADEFIPLVNMVKTHLNFINTT